MEIIRADKYLSECLQSTRSVVKKMIRDKKVTCNGVLIRNPEEKIHPEKDCVCVEGKKVTYEPFQYFMLNKPEGVISASTDEECETVCDLVDGRKDLFPVGRLDKDTTGLLLLTNDGKLAHELLSPRHHVKKIYIAKVQGEYSDMLAEAFAKGFEYGEKKPSLPAELVFLKKDQDNYLCQVTIKEGKFHQIKRMFSMFNQKVIGLERIQMGPLKLDSALALGEYRKLTQEEITCLKEASRAEQKGDQE